MKEKQVIKNAKWIIFCKIVQSLIQLVIGMLSARYLGPSNYGLINYAASIVAFALPITQLGFEAIMVYELVENPDREGEIIGTCLILNIISSILCIFGVAAFATIANHGDGFTILVCVLYSLSLFFAAIEMIQYWYQYKLFSKYSSVVMLVAYSVVSVYKIFLLATEKSVLWFAVSHSIEYAIIGFSLLILYFSKGGQRFSFSLERAKKMFSKGKHYILASMMVVIIQNTDRIMLTAIIGKAENGYYSAAITCATVLQFVFVAIVDSFRPYILSEKKRDEYAYEASLKKLYSVEIYLSVIQSVAFVLFARIIILVLYGSDYASAVSVLRILAVYFIFSVMGLVRNVWILAEEKQKYLWIINGSGALLNIILNSFMIPLWHANGAALASLISQLFANFILGFIIKPLRKNNSLIIQSLNPRLFCQEAAFIVKNLIKKA